MKRIILLSAMLINKIICLGQSKGLQPGDKVPETVFNKLYASYPTVLKREAAKGKLILLDMWNVHCGGCLHLMPKMAALEQKFKDDMLIWMPTEDKKKAVDDFFKKRSELKKLDLTIIHDAKLLNDLFPHFGVPHYVWIGKDRIVKAITGSNDVTEENITQLLKTGEIDLRQKTDFKLKEGVPMLADFRAPIGPKLMYSSVLTDTLNLLEDADRIKGPGPYNGRSVRCTNCQVLELYNLAYLWEVKTGRSSTERLICQAKDLDLAKRFTYELIVPAASFDDKAALKYMRGDLDRYFHLQSRVVKKAVPVYVLKYRERLEGETSKPVSKTGQLEFVGVEHADYDEFNNTFVKDLPSTLGNRCNQKFRFIYDGPPNLQISINLKLSYNNLDEIREVLKDFGIYIDGSVMIDDNFLELSDEEKE